MNILITSAGRRSYLIKYFKKALKNTGLIHASNSEWSSALQAADKAVITPPIYSSCYIKFILKYALDNKISVIISLFDIDLLVLSRNKKLFEKKGIKIIVSDYKTIQICNDKWKTFKFLKSIKIPTPESCLSIKKCKQKINNGNLNYPLIIKPRWGMGSIGIYQANNELELNILFKKTLNNILNSYLKYESEININKSIIIQQKLEGNEYGLDVFNDLKGKFLACVPKRKISMRAGETDSAEIIDEPSLFKLGYQLSSSLKFISNLDVDCFKVKNNYYILELNCRFGGQYPFSHIAGANFPKALIRMLENKTIEKKLLTAKPGTIGTKDITPIILKNE